MYYLLSPANSRGSWYVTDTEDGVTEMVDYDTISDLVLNKGIYIAGVTIVEPQPGSRARRYLSMRPYTGMTNKATAKAVMLENIAFQTDDSGCIRQLSWANEKPPAELVEVYLSKYGTSVGNYALDHLSNAKVIFDEKCKTAEPYSCRAARHCVFDISRVSGLKDARALYKTLGYSLTGWADSKIEDSLERMYFELPCTIIVGQNRIYSVPLTPEQDNYLWGRHGRKLLNSFPEPDNIKYTLPHFYGVEDMIKDVPFIARMRADEFKKHLSQPLETSDISKVGLIEGVPTKTYTFEYSYNPRSMNNRGVAVSVVEKMTGFSQSALNRVFHYFASGGNNQELAEKCVMFYQALTRELKSEGYL